MYTRVDRFRHQPFLPRVVATWRRLDRLSCGGDGGQGRFQRQETGSVHENLPEIQVRDLTRHRIRYRSG
jgi:hypothetical protein